MMYVYDPFLTPGGCHVDELGKYAVDFLMFQTNCQGSAVDAVDHENYRLLKVPDLQGQHWMRLNIDMDSTDARNTVFNLVAA